MECDAHSDFRTEGGGLVAACGTRGAGAATTRLVVLGADGELLDDIDVDDSAVLVPGFLRTTAPSGGLRLPTPTFDNTTPAVSSGPTAITSNAGKVTFEIDFAEAVRTQVAGDFAVTGTASGCSVSKIEGSGKYYLVDVTCTTTTTTQAPGGGGGSSTTPTTVPTASAGAETTPVSPSTTVPPVKTTVPTAPATTLPAAPGQVSPKPAQATLVAQRTGGVLADSSLTVGERRIIGTIETAKPQRLGVEVRNRKGRIVRKLSVNTAINRDFTLFLPKGMYSVTVRHAKAGTTRNLWNVPSVRVG